ncbi:orotidine 5'-phosphate decarboxylase [bacterium]|nr:orotidine 5'-phosphate decarboxylase [bacterium]
MKIQVALDILDRNKALEITRQVAPYADIIEVGTPLLKAQGMGIVRKIKEEFPYLLVLADTKTMDVGALEAKMAFDAGADIMTVCAQAELETIESAIMQAKNQDKKVVVDFIGVKEKISRGKEIELFLPDYFSFHIAIDVQNSKGIPFNEIEKFSKSFSIPIAIAGGLKPEDIKYLIQFNPEILIFGSYITRSKNPKEAILKIKEEIYANEKKSI